jgi:hypothetical protein
MSQKFRFWFSVTFYFGISVLKIQEIPPNETASELPGITEIESEVERNIM